jgi:hypothetical protein
VIPAPTRASIIISRCRIPPARMSGSAWAEGGKLEQPAGRGRAHCGDGGEGEAVRRKLFGVVRAGRCLGRGRPGSGVG